MRMRIVRSALVAATLAAPSLQALPAEAGFFQDLHDLFHGGGPFGDNPFVGRYERQTVSYPTKEALRRLDQRQSSHYFNKLFGSWIPDRSC